MSELKIVESGNFERSDALVQLQKMQLEHDKTYHPDILYNLSTQDKLKHYTLHYSKYCGKLVSILSKYDADIFRRTLVDAYIITLTFANMLNINLGRIALAKGNFARSELIYNFVEITGRIAKGVESIDHVEKGDHRSSIEHETALAFLTLECLVNELGLDIKAEIETRWNQIEKNHLFS